MLCIASAWPVHAGWREALGWTSQKAVDTFSSWRDRMFSVIRDDEPLADANSNLPIVPTMNVPERFVISTQSPQRAFPEGESRYRLIELSRTYAHVAVRLRVMAVPNPDARGNSVFKPIIYVIGDDEQVRDSQEAEPLLIDIQPFKRTRLLACVSLENVRRFAIATPAAAVDTFYETKSRSKLEAPKTSYGFYYSTEPVKVKLPYKSTGEMVLEVTREERAGAGCDGHGDDPKLDGESGKDEPSDDKSEERKSSD
ncbi:MAG: hypothetical protein WBP11_15550 [Dokdonella sp.]